MSSASLQNFAKQYLWGAPKNPVITISPGTWPVDPGDSVTVTISLVYPMAIPFSKMNQIIVGTSAQATVLQ